MAIARIDLREVVTDSLISMIEAVTGLKKPEGPPPDFIQAAIDSAVTRIADAAYCLPVTASSTAEAHAFDKKLRDDVAKALGLHPLPDRDFAWVLLLQRIKSNAVSEERRYRCIEGEDFGETLGAMLSAGQQKGGSHD